MPEHCLSIPLDWRIICFGSMASWVARSMYHTLFTLFTLNWVESLLLTLLFLGMDLTALAFRTKIYMQKPFFFFPIPTRHLIISGFDFWAIALCQRYFEFNHSAVTFKSRLFIEANQPQIDWLELVSIFIFLSLRGQLFHYLKHFVGRSKILKLIVKSIFSPISFDF